MADAFGVGNLRGYEFFHLAQKDSRRGFPGRPLLQRRVLGALLGARVRTCAAGWHGKGLKKFKVTLSPPPPTTGFAFAISTISPQLRSNPDESRSQQWASQKIEP
jgi:hypothetical protein